jgi:ornithine cyclodeaminase/alanine dehydrogenase
MVLLLSESDVTNSLSMADGVRVLEQAFTQHALGGHVVMPRTSADLPGNGGAFRVMSAILPELGFFGLKTLTGYPGRRLPGETYFAVLLFSCETGALRAIIAGNRLTGVRTGAATAVAAKYLARPNSRVLGILGAGVQARYQVAALLEVRPVNDIRVFDLDTGKAEEFAREIENTFAVSARAVAQARDAVAECDLVVTATAAKTPVFDGNWLEPGTHISAVGANSPAKRELDPATLRNKKIVVDFRDQVLQEAGDIQEALRSGAIQEASIHAELSEVVTGAKTGRVDGTEITIFKSVGMATEDIATASFAYKQALAAGLGTRIELDGAPLIQRTAV